MTHKPFRPAVALLLVTVGLLLLGAGYLAGRGALQHERIVAAPERTEELPGTPRSEPAHEAGRRKGETDPQERGAAVRPETEPGEARPGETAVVRFGVEGLKLARLRIEPVRRGSVRTRLVVTGTVEPNLAGVVRVTPRVAGKIITVPVNVGDSVRAGQTLATLASTGLAQAQAAYRQGTARVAVARSDLQRQQELARLGAFGRPAIEAARTQAATADAESDTARSELEVARAGVTEAESQVRSLRAALDQAQTEVKVTRSRFNRADFLLKEGIVSQQAWEQAQADYQHSQADVEAAQANVVQGQAKLETARANLKAAQVKGGAARHRGQIAAEALAREEAVFRGHYLTSKEIVAAEAAWRQAQLDQRAAAASIRLLGGIPGGSDTVAVKAPLSGRVTERLVSLGETVTPDKAVFTIMNLNTVWVQLSVYPENVAAVRNGQAVTVASDTAPGRRFVGAVSSISDVVDEATRTVKVRCVIRNVDSLLKPQTFVRGTIAAGGREEAIMIPREAVQQWKGRSVVFRPADKPSEFQPRLVVVGEERGGLVVIRAGLQAGDRIVTRNAFLIKAEAMKSELGDEDEEKPKP